MKEVEGKQKHKEFPVANFDTTVDQCKVYVVADFKKAREGDYAET